MLGAGWTAVVALAAAYFIALVTTPAGISGAVLLPPFQAAVLGTPSLAITPTNLVYNVVATPGALYRYWRQGQTGGRLALVLIAGTLPGVIAGSVIRVELLPGEDVFAVVIAVVLIPLGSWLALTRPSDADAPGRPARGIPVPVLVALAAAVGVVGGIYGIGGGAILAPVLIGSGQRASVAAPAALAATFVTSVAGVTTFTLLSLYHPGAVAPDWSTGLALGAGGLAGGYTGARIQGRMPDIVIRRLVGVLVIAVGAGYLWSATVLRGYRLVALRQRRDAFPASGRVISGQVGKLIDQPCRGEDLEQALHFTAGELPGRYHQVEMLSGQRDEGQAVGAGGRLARDSRVGQARRDGRGHLQVPGRLGVIAGELAGLDPGLGHLAVQQAACLGARFPVRQPQPALGQVGDAGDAFGQAGAEDQSFLPRAEPDHLTAAGQQLSGRPDVVFDAMPAQVRPGDMHQSLSGQRQRFPARARPPGERHRRVEQPQRFLQQRQRRITARRDQGRPRRLGGPDRPGLPSPALACLSDQPARREKPGPGCRLAPQGQRDMPVSHLGEGDPGSVAAERGDLSGRDRHYRVLRPE